MKHYNIYYKFVKEKGGTIDKIRGLSLGFKLGFTLGRNGYTEKTVSLPNGYWADLNIDEKTAKKLYKILLSNYLICDVKVEKI